MVSTLIWRHVSLLMLFSQTFYGLLFCYLTITDVTLYLQIVDFQFPSAVHRNPKKLNQIITVNSSTNTPITKKITLARFACLCLSSQLQSTVCTMRLLPGYVIAFDNNGLST